MKLPIHINYKKILIITLLAVLFVGCDQSSKRLARKHLEASVMVTYLYGVVRLVYVENPGGMLSIGSKLSNEIRFYVLVAGVSILLCILFFYLILKREITSKDIALLLIFSGGASNLIDRISNNGNVIDFIMVGSAKLHTAVFNLADLFILTGAIIFFLSFSKKEKINF